jgi:hypothetical protein
LDEEGREMHRKHQKCEEPNKNGKTRKYDIKMDLSRISCGVVDLIYLVQVREQRQILVNIIMYFQVLYKAGKSEWLNNWYRLFCGVSFRVAEQLVPSVLWS